MRAGDPPVRFTKARIASLQWSFVQWQGTCLIRSLCGFDSRSSDFRSGIPGANACAKEAVAFQATHTLAQQYRSANHKCSGDVTAAYAFSKPGVRVQVPFRAFIVFFPPKGPMKKTD